MSGLISPVRIESTGGLPSWFRRIAGADRGLAGLLSGRSTRATRAG